MQIMNKVKATFVCLTKSGENSWWSISTEVATGRFRKLPGLMRFEGPAEAGETFEFTCKEIKQVEMVLPDGRIMMELVAF
jgi:hypothetical protein